MNTKFKNEKIVALFTFFLALCFFANAEEPEEKPWADENYYVEAPDIITIDCTKTDKKAFERIFGDDFVLKENTTIILFTVDEKKKFQSSQEFTIGRGGVLDLRETLKRKTARVVISDLTISEARELVQTQFPYGTKIKIAVPKMIIDEHFLGANYLVGPDGYITFANQRIYVNGFTTKEIAQAIELQFPNLEKGSIDVSVFAYNSKEFYVIFRHENKEKGDQIHSFACTEKSALRSELNVAMKEPKLEFPQIPENARVWIARHDVNNPNYPKILLNAAWKTITTNPKFIPVIEFLFRCRIKNKKFVRK